jgi:transketolase C-terminal domain/subunit
MSKEISTLPDGTVRMCLTEDGITACTYVSSHHLVEDKWGYLRQSIKRQAERAYEQPC